jgi:outer membrane cobalamin receptor
MLPRLSNPLRLILTNIMKSITCGSQLFLLFFLAPVLLWAQSSDLASVSGYIRSESGEPLVGISVSLKGTSNSIYTDENGYYKLDQIEGGKYTLVISGLGYDEQQKQITLNAGEASVQDLGMKTESKTMDEVHVYGRSETREVQLQAYNVTAIDARKLHNSTLDLGHALDRVSGVRVREDGGLGSRMTFSLNGFTGRQVKFFIDGIPMDNFGSSFQLNSIPINLADRIEIYKGVVPIWLGSDALGGAVNIVTTNQPVSYLDVSYTTGSFNTHRSSLNAGYIAKSGFTVQVNAFQNYSHNNYWVTAKITDIASGEFLGERRVRRFHDKYHNETAIVNVGVVGKKYADKLLFGFTYGKNYSDIQTDARMLTVFGDTYRKGNIIMPSVRYIKKDLLTKGLDLTITGNYNLGSEQNIDTVNRRYNWIQQYVEKSNIAGGERSRSLYKYRNNNGLATAILNYKISARNTITISNVFNTFNRVGSDELTPENKNYEQPRYRTKNILGVGYRFDYNERWNTTLFAKYYSQQTKYSQAITTGGWGSQPDYLVQRNFFNNLGYGIASTYFLLKNLQVKGSFEKTYRLPETDELFGDLINLAGNIDLKPETSYNYNLGLSYSWQINKAHRFSIDANALFRDSRDFIRPRLIANQDRLVMENRERVKNLAFDAEVRYSYKRLITAGVNMTYQNLRNYTKHEDGQRNVSILYLDRMPNAPFLFGNADASVFIRKGSQKRNGLAIGYNLLYVHSYYLNWPKLGNEKFNIPMQISHDLNMVYTMANGKYNISLECRNVFDSMLFDNFKLQKPGRAFYLKLRYFISKK